MESAAMTKVEAPITTEDDTAEFSLRQPALESIPTHLSNRNSPNEEDETCVDIYPDPEDDGVEVKPHGKPISKSIHVEEVISKHNFLAGMAPSSPPKFDEDEIEYSDASPVATDDEKEGNINEFISSVTESIDEYSCRGNDDNVIIPSDDGSDKKHIFFTNSACADTESFSATFSSKGSEINHLEENEDLCNNIPRTRVLKNEDIFFKCKEAIAEYTSSGLRVTCALQRDVFGVLINNTYSVALTNEDAAFVLGKAGNTKRKISKVSGCHIELDDEGLRLDVTGTEEQRERAILYIKLILKQRIGPVELIFDPAHRNDLTVLEIPHSAVGYVTGAHGCVLRRVEDEWGTLMFFVGGPQKESNKEAKPLVETTLATTTTATTISPEMDGVYPLEKLLIFGNQRNRRGAELKIMSAVEQKRPGFFISSIQTERKSSKEDFDTDIVFIAPDDFSYSLGKEGRTRKKLARASGCILEYVGRIAFMSGTLEERRRVRDYLNWLIKQRTEAVDVNLNGRTDVSTVDIRLDCVAYVTGKQGQGLRDTEDRTGTFCFFDRERNEEKRSTERLLIFGADESDRMSARRLILDMMDQKLRKPQRFRSSGISRWPPSLPPRGRRFLPPKTTIERLRYYQRRAAPLPLSSKKKHLFLSQSRLRHRPPFPSVHSKNDASRPPFTTHRRSTEKAALLPEKRRFDEPPFSSEVAISLSSRKRGATASSGFRRSFGEATELEKKHFEKATSYRRGGAPPPYAPYDPPRRRLRMSPDPQASFHRSASPPLPLPFSLESKRLRASRERFPAHPRFSPRAPFLEGAASGERRDERRPGDPRKKETSRAVSPLAWRKPRTGGSSLWGSNMHRTGERYRLPSPLTTATTTKRHGGRGEAPFFHASQVRKREEGGTPTPFPEPPPVERKRDALRAHSCSPPPAMDPYARPLSKRPRVKAEDLHFLPSKPDSPPAHASRRGFFYSPSSRWLATGSGKEVLASPSGGGPRALSCEKSRRSASPVAGWPPQEASSLSGRAFLPPAPPHSLSAASKTVTRPARRYSPLASRAVAPLVSEETRGEASSLASLNKLRKLSSGRSPRRDAPAAYVKGGEAPRTPFAASFPYATHRPSRTHYPPQAWREARSQRERRFSPSLGAPAHPLFKKPHAAFPSLGKRQAPPTHTETAKVPSSSLTALPRVEPPARGYEHASNDSRGALRPGGEDEVTTVYLGSLGREGGSVTATYGSSPSPPAFLRKTKNLSVEEARLYSAAKSGKDAAYRRSNNRFIGYKGYHAEKKEHHRPPRAMMNGRFSPEGGRLRRSISLEKKFPPWERQKFVSSTTTSYNYNNNSTSQNHTNNAFRRPNRLPLGGASLSKQFVEKSERYVFTGDDPHSLVHRRHKPKGLP